MKNAVDIKDLFKRYDEVIAVDHISFEVGKGEMDRPLTGYQAPSGADQANFEVFFHEILSNKTKLGRLDNDLKDWSKSCESQEKSYGRFVAIESVQCIN